MPGIGGGGFLGIALEATSGTYVAPTLFVPIQSESLQYIQETNFRRPIRQAVGVVGAVAGNSRIEGDISMEAFDDAVAVFLHAARATAVKAGTPPNFNYQFTPNSLAIPAKTLSIVVSRNGQAFAYTGCVVSSFTFTIENGTLMFNVSILGRDEATQLPGVPLWPTTQVPFGAGTYDIQIPTSTQVFDVDTFEFTVDDGAEAQYRLKNTGTGAQFVNYGERAVTVSAERDFETRADYDAFKALTAQSLTFTASRGANNRIIVLVPVAVKDTYEVALSGQGDLIRAAIQYQGVMDNVGKDYQITVHTQVNVTIL